jgi:hypothetical protein
LGENRQRRVVLLTIAVAESGERIPMWERKPEELFQALPMAAPCDRFGLRFYRETVIPIFQRELSQRGIITDGVSYHEELVAWVEGH